MAFIDLTKAFDLFSRTGLFMLTTRTVNPSSSWRRSCPSVPTPIELFSITNHLRIDTLTAMVRLVKRVCNNNLLKIKTKNVYKALFLWQRSTSDRLLSMIEQRLVG
ncbi:unnamed protein product [Clavelina lepadiformis]|uniref:Reverse transcriptase domain-containing protein n=1 Tax=Clavelina lepadiformis TaxID=159417 RepID=A0ABP0FW20_CLALP